MADIDPWLPDRLAAVARIVRAEGEIEEAARRSILHWLAELVRRILSGNSYDLSRWSEADEAWNEAFREILAPAIGEWFGDRFLAFARAAEISAQPYREQYIDTVYSRLRLFPAEQFEEIRPEITEAISQGETVIEIRERISAVLDFDTAADAGSGNDQARTREIQGRINEVEREIDDPLTPEDRVRELRRERARLYPELYRTQNRWEWKAERIARTETIGALNGGTFAGASVRQEVTGEVQYKRWLATDDSRTRPAHVLADNQVRRMQSPFLVGGAPLMYPGDPSGPAHLTIQCRCTMLTHDEDELDDDDRASLLAGGSMADAMDCEDSDHDGECDESVYESMPDGWRGVMGPLDILTGDRRILATPERGFRTRSGTIPLMWQRSTAPGHDGSVIIGRADRTWIDHVGGVDVVMGEGPLDLAGVDGFEAARLLHGGMLTGMSIDPDQVTGHVELRTSQGYPIDTRFMDPDDVMDLLLSGDVMEVFVMTDWRLMGATLLPFPAYDEARIQPVYGYQPSDDESPGGAMTDDEIPVYQAAFFEDPQLDSPTALMVTVGGRVYGHVATWDTCHVGIPDTCTTAPRSKTGYAYFHVGSAMIDTGDVIPVGRLTLGGGHADASSGYRAATDHYDNTCTAVAVVRAGEDAHGIWIAGQIIPGTSGDDVATLMRSPLSGDWRRIGGHLEMVAALAVNVPGFPIPRTMTAATDQGQISLCAAGVVARPVREPLDYTRIAREVVVAQMAQARQRHRADRIAMRIGEHPQQRAEELARGIDE